MFLTVAIIVALLALYLSFNTYREAKKRKEEALQRLEEVKEKYERAKKGRH
ncbi:hypothetical protein [Aneurinibacillus aneurinilyticus]|uniref:Uncharacterized protein n=1 Tax=Aneurinibacillus aneurinilyticus TaxID=1391 RepID=A0A848D6F2_ANEAE|nr:hypothetical protein [Aneurinibacillus aneurinilyticus]NMF01361.1 hypothetical protein [Aneurinibacillus aneurinilyticus]